MSQVNTAHHLSSRKDIISQSQYVTISVIPASFKLKMLVSLKKKSTKTPKESYSLSWYSHDIPHWNALKCIKMLETCQILPWLQCPGVSGGRCHGRVGRRPHSGKGSTTQGQGEVGPRSGEATDVGNPKVRWNPGMGFRNFYGMVMGWLQLLLLLQKNGWWWMMVTWFDGFGREDLRFLSVIVFFNASLDDVWRPKKRVIDGHWSTKGYRMQQN